MSDELEKSVNAIRELVGLFRVERITYLCISVASVIILLVAAIGLLYKGEGTDDTLAVMGLFGSGGGIAFSTGRLLKMYSDAVKMIMNQKEKTNE